MIKKLNLLTGFVVMQLVCQVYAADTIPTDIEQPGTQPEELTAAIVPVRNGQYNCHNCHSNYESEPKVEPWYNWQGSMMSHAGRDPLFWATMAIAEQTFDGSGDLCLRCHAPKGWLEGRSTPTDGSALLAGDQNGVECGFCHRLTNPDDSEHQGVQNAPYVANDSGDPDGISGNIKAYHGTGMASVLDTREILGPYAGISVGMAHGNTRQSQFHRSVDFCGTCHDVSNPAVGDLAHNHGAQATADPVVADGTPGSAVNGKAAFNNLPYKYGIVERTFSEYKASPLSRTLISDYSRLPLELQAGAIANARTAALLAGQNGNYADGTPRYFSCQSCHMQPVVGQGAGFPGGPPTRTDLPLHDLTGGNYWVPQAIEYLDGLGKLRLGGGLDARQIAATRRGAERAKGQLESAASLRVTGDVLKVVNLTAHKLISGYPEGRRMWLNIKWFNGANTLLREDGAYGPLKDGNGDAVTVIDPSDGVTRVQVRSLLNLEDANTKVYEAHYGLTREWAQQLHAMGKDDSLVIQYDRLTGSPILTLGQLRAQAAASEAKSFHFVLNNTVVKDNRIPPWEMDFEDARKRNILPVPVAQYDGSPQEAFRFFDVVKLNPPAGAVRAEVRLMYQPTSWEYIQFLSLSNNGTVSFLKDEGKNLLQAWLHTGMAEPHVMATANWVPADCSGDGIDADISGWVFVDTRTCTASNSILAPGVLVDAGAQLTLVSKAVTLGKGFAVEEGAQLNVRGM
ncbi:MAG TPA: hypothetical protein EYP34_04905 [Chromatiaceae bacterium]|nr:hypothetical protein [Chromatiaceae bacterium]